jgi:hypothetical protein
LGAYDAAVRLRQTGLCEEKECGEVPNELDLETLKVALRSIDEFASRELPDTQLIELDERHEFPEQIVLRSALR